MKQMRVFWVDQNNRYSPFPVPNCPSVYEDGTPVGEEDVLTADPDRPGGFLGIPSAYRASSVDDPLSPPDTVSLPARAIGTLFRGAGALGAAAIVLIVIAFFVGGSEGLLMGVGAIALWGGGYYLTQQEKERDQEAALGGFKPGRLDPSHLSIPKDSGIGEAAREYLAGVGVGLSSLRLEKTPKTYYVGDDGQLYRPAMTAMWEDTPLARNLKIDWGTMFGYYGRQFRNRGLKGGCLAMFPGPVLMYRIFRWFFRFTDRTGRYAFGGLFAWAVLTAITPISTPGWLWWVLIATMFGLWGRGFGLRRKQIVSSVLAQSGWYAAPGHENAPAPQTRPGPPV